jgi:hypothetical protein
MAIPVVLLVAGLMAAGSQAKTDKVTPQQVVLRPLATGISSQTATPATVSFALTDPTAAAVTGTSTVSWHTSGGSTASTWTLGASAAASSFTGCTEIPQSAVTVHCASVTGGTAGACGGVVTLSGAAQTIASGKEATGNTAYSVVVTISITDSWTYKGHTTACTLVPTWTITAP